MTTHKLPKELARRFDVSVVRLRRREIQLIKKMGADRVEELRLFFAKEMSPCEEEAFKRSMDLSDKELVWLWKLIDRAHDEQVEAWRDAALSGALAPKAELTDADEWSRGRRRGRVHGRVDPQALERIIGA